MNSKNKRVVLRTTIFAMGLLMILVTSYAYIRLNPINDEKHLDLNVNTAKNMVLTYKDCLSDVDEDVCSEINGTISPGGSIEKPFSITNNNGGDIRFNIYFEEIVNSFKNEELVYSLVNVDTNTPLVEDIVLPSLEINHKIIGNVIIKAGETQNYKVILKLKDTDYDQSANLKSNFYVRIGLLEIDEPTTFQNKLVLVAKDSTPEYANLATTDEGVYKLEDNYGTSYYYRGNVQNNYLQYAGLYWRIVRMNGDGTVRIMYDGTTPHNNNESSSDRVVINDAEWNRLANDNKYVGYMYGNLSSSKSEAQKNSTSSNIKTKLEEWYKANIYDKGYDDDIADSLFCNNRSTEDNMGYGTIASTYSASSRTTPSFTCGSTNDAYTVLDNTNGNASLKYPIGLITLDEIIAAGAGTTLSNTNADYYMNRGMSYWTMTPYEYNLTAHNAFINENGGIEKADVYTKKGIVPVINLNSNMLTNVTGTGTISDPYVIKPKIIVTFDSNGGSGSYTKSVRVGEPYGEFPNVTRDGYELDGWYTDSIEGEKIESFTLLTKNESHTVYAHWKKISEVKLTLSVLTKNGTVVNSGTPDFTKTATTDEGLYMMTDDDGTSYYFRGAIEDNYVKFGKNSAGKDMWWRIIRINGNGSLRMIYDGTSAHVNGESYINDKVALSSVAWNTSNYNDAKYVGYMYGGTNGKLSTSKEQAQTNETESNIKVQLESWYEQNIDNTSYKEYISDEVFCNDRSTPDHGYALGYEQNQTHYGAYERLITNKTPTFKCDMNDISLTTSLESDNDRFTVGEEKGNGKLKYPVGLITADEIAAAGGVAPVINLKADVAATLKGSGTMTDPYRIS